MHLYEQNFKITNNNYYNALPECLSLLMKQTSENYKKFEKSVIKKILGKRKKRDNSNKNSNT